MCLKNCSASNQIFFIKLFLQRKVSTLRILDLKHILSVIGDLNASKNVRKDDLQKRVFDLLKPRQLKEAQQQELRRLIEQSVNKM